MKFDNTGEISDLVYVPLTKIYIAVLRTSVTDENDVKLIPISKFSCWNYKSIVVSSNFNQVMNV